MKKTCDLTWMGGHDMIVIVIAKGFYETCRSKGYMENIWESTRQPFDESVSFIKLFDAKTRTAIMGAIDRVRDNAVEIAAS